MEELVFSTTQERHFFSDEQASFYGFEEDPP
jgi:hypothetical protein